MNRRELTAVVADKIGMYHKDVDKVVGKLVEEIQERLAAGENVKIQGLGTFEVKERAARTGRDIANGKPVQVPSRRIPSFKASKMLKDKVELS